MSAAIDHIRSVIPTLGRTISADNSAVVRGLYKPLLKHSKADVSLDADIAYGDDARQKLDIYWTPATTLRPMFLYVPGGGFVGGDKNADDTFYANIGVWAAKAGMVGATMNYRLAPHSTWPGAAMDIATAVKKLKDSATTYGGDPTRMFIMGHSAGATHVATYLFDPDIKGDAQMRAAWLSSGLYEISEDEKRPAVLSYFGPDTSAFARRSPINFIGQSTLPVGLSAAEYDPPEFVTPTLDVAKLLCQRDKACPTLTVLDGHNHFSNVCSLGSSDDTFGNAILAFLKKHAG